MQAGEYKIPYHLPCQVINYYNIVINLKVLFSIFLITIFALSCKNADKKKKSITTVVGTKKTNQDSLRKKLNDIALFIGDSLLNGKKSVLVKYLDKYQSDTCGIIVYEKPALDSRFEGLKNIGDINHNKINDTVFVLPPFNYCDDGYSYVFFDTTLPRLLTDSYCCHPDNLFSIGDIDENGISEICLFYSSCTSRFKSLIAYSLKGNQWQQIGRCTFDINVMTPAKEKRVRKISKGKFEMLEIVIDNFEKRPLGDKEWKQFSF